MRHGFPVPSALPLAASLAFLLPPSAAIATVPTGFTDEQVIGGLSQPVGFAFLPDGRILVIEQVTGDIELVRMTPDAASATIFTVSDIPPKPREQGLLGIAVDPRWPSPPYLYVFFDKSPGGTIYIRRYTASGSLTDPTSLALVLDRPYEILTDIPDESDFHNGGTLRFGTDGMLYASLGDDFMVPCDAQALAALKGKILRLHVASLPDTGTGPPPKSLITPPDNPHVTDPSANARLVFCRGLRNPFRFTVDSRNGELYIGDVGASAWEELDRGNPGDNFGWPRREGAHTGPQPGCVGSNGEDPIAEFPHAAGSIAIIAGPRYRPVAGPAGVHDFPFDYDGDVFFAEYYQGFVRRYRETSPGSWALAPPAPGQPTATEWATGLTNVSDMQVGPDGAIWYVKQFGPSSLRRIVGTPSTSVAEGGDATVPVHMSARGFALAVSPNPARAGGTVSITYAIPRASMITISIHDVTGARVATILQSRQNVGAGSLACPFPPDLSPGVYFICLELGGSAVSEKLTILPR